MALLQKLVGRLRRVHNTGWRRSLRIAVDRGALKVLQKVYGFHPWHVSAPLSARPYRRLVAALVNGISPSPRVVVEVGCGLGSILSLLRAPVRVGYDLDGGAIRAAQLLHGTRISFVQGGFDAMNQERIDVLILVNWIHDVPPAQLKSWLEPLLSRTEHLVVDAIDSDNPVPYPYRHDFRFLNGRVREVQGSRAANEGRRFILYEVVK